MQRHASRAGMSRASRTQVLSRIPEGVRLSSLGTEVGLRNSAPFSLLRRSDLKQLERRPGLVIRTLRSHSGNNRPGTVLSSWHSALRGRDTVISFYRERVQSSDQGCVLAKVTQPGSGGVRICSQCLSQNIIKNKRATGGKDREKG